MEKILVDQEGYDQYFKELEKLQQQSNINSIEGSKSYVDATGDGWHDNFSFEESMRESRTIATKIDEMLANSKKLIIVKEEHNINDKSIIKLNDKLTINVKYSEDDNETYNIILTGKYIPLILDNNLTEITLNSPIGKAIYLKKVGDKIHTKINNNDVEIKILKKIP